ARPRPGLVQEVRVLGVDTGIIEKVDGRPAPTRFYAERCQRSIKIVRAVGVTRIAEGVVVARRTSEAGGVVAADGVAHDFDQRLQVVIEELAVEAGSRIAESDHAARRRHIETALDALVQLARIEGLEVGTLPAGLVDDLDVLARLHQIAT